MDTRNDIESPTTEVLPQEARQKRRARVLCIDDHITGLTIRKLLLESQGYAVTTAATADDALLLFGAQEFDLVITDYYLPGVTGADLASDFKRMKPTLPVLLFSGSVAVPDHLGGADLFLSKAEDTQTFLRIVRELLAKARAPQYT
jgi:CheY-like chemotaxis protein